MTWWCGPNFFGVHKFFSIFHYFILNSSFLNLEILSIWHFAAMSCDCHVMGSSRYNGGVFASGVNSETSLANNFKTDDRKKHFQIFHNNLIDWFQYLPPATKLGQGNIFRSKCQEFCLGGMHGMGACMAGEGGMCGRGAWQGGMLGRGGIHGRYYKIRSMSGRYASYWNAFLFILNLELIFLPRKETIVKRMTDIVNF